MQSLTKTNCTLLGDLEDFYATQDLSTQGSFRTKKLFNNISITKTLNRQKPTENQSFQKAADTWFQSLISLHLTELHWNIFKPEKKEKTWKESWSLLFTEEFTQFL